MCLASIAFVSHLLHELVGGQGWFYPGTCFFLFFVVTLLQVFLAKEEVAKRYGWEDAFHGKYPGQLSAA